MDFALSEEQGFIRDTIRKFIAKECDRAKIQKMDEAGDFPQDFFQTVAQMGFCALTIPESYGGGGPDALGASMVAQELAMIYPVLAGVFTAVAFRGGTTISQLGSDSQKEKFLPDLVQGSTIFTYGIEEPDFSYGVGPVKTCAKQKGDEFVIQGTKSFVSLADHADYIITLASTDPEGDLKSTATWFVIDTSDPKVCITPQHAVGFNGASVCEVVFDEVRVSAESVLGGPDKVNKGFDQMGQIMAARHLEVASIAAGLAQGAYDYAVKYAKEREQFGRPIAHFGSVKCMLVDMAIKINAAKNLLYQACWLADTEGSFLAEAIMARICASQAARSASMDCVQILGGYGYANEYDAQRYLRDSLVLFEGDTTEEELKDSLAGLLNLV